MNFKTLIQKPHPFIFNRNSVLIPFILTVLTIVILKPFEFAYLPYQKLLFWAVVFGFVTSALILGVVWLLQKFFSGFMNEEKWTVGKEFMLILLVVFSIAVVVFILFYILYSEEESIILFSDVFLRTILISIFPIIILVLFEQYHYKKNMLEKAQYLNQQLDNKLQEKENLNTNCVITFKSENNTIVFRINSEDILFIKSDGNYVEVFYYQKNELKKELLRNRLKVIEEILPSKYFYRCHKSFIVNLNYVLKVDGNARNLDLTLQNTDIQIPVSRNHAKQLLQFFNDEF